MCYTKYRMCRMPFHVLLNHFVHSLQKRVEMDINKFHPRIIPPLYCKMKKTTSELSQSVAQSLHVLYVTTVPFMGVEFSHFKIVHCK